MKLLGILMAFMVALPFVYSNAMAHAPKAKAVVFFSEQCGSCKIIDPLMQEALTKIDGDKIDVVKFDFTDAQAIQKTKALAADKDVRYLLTEYGAKTGFIVLLDKDGKMTDKITKTDDLESIVNKLQTVTS